MLRRLQMRGAARPGSYRNQWKGAAISRPKPRRNRSNTSPDANKTIPAETPTIPVTLIIRPILIPLSAIADLLTPLFDHLVGAGKRLARARNRSSTRKMLNARWQCCPSAHLFLPDRRHRRRKIPVVEAPNRNAKLIWT